ncbi:MAG: hypothetical protein WDW36_000599 [Sanguina aurantia]
MSPAAGANSASNTSGVQTGGDGSWIQQISDTSRPDPLPPTLQTGPSSAARAGAGTLQQQALALAEGKEMRDHLALMTLRPGPPMRLQPLHDSEIVTESVTGPDHNATLQHQRLQKRLHSQMEHMQQQQLRHQEQQLHIQKLEQQLQQVQGQQVGEVQASGVVQTLRPEVTATTSTQFAEVVLDSRIFNKQLRDPPAVDTPYAAEPNPGSQANKQQDSTAHQLPYRTAPTSVHSTPAPSATGSSRPRHALIMATTQSHRLSWHQERSDIVDLIKKLRWEREEYANLRCELNPGCSVDFLQGFQLGVYEEICIGLA